ncbi:RNA-directed DNA polymerase, eukaryota, reverse transcriptase zinc-binding domain protein [Tanacetum coccineum]
MEEVGILIMSVHLSKGWLYWRIKGKSEAHADKQNEVRNFIANEGLSTCDVLETHIKSKSINKVGNDIFGRWEWYSNMKAIVIKDKKRAFKFTNFIADKKELLSTVRKGWEDEYEGCKMFKTIKKLKDVQLRIDKDPYDKDLRNKESKCLSEYVEAMKDKEKLLYQKAKIKWLRSICDHFQAFLGNTETVKDCDYIIPLIKRKLNAYTTNFMVRDVCSEEIKAAMFQIKSNKVPRLDGFTSLFFKKAWSIMSEDVCSAIRGQNQSAFVPNRHIQDNILLSQELLKGYERKDGPCTVAMQIVSKAVYGHYYDDLLMFCYKDKRSVQILKEAIEDFGLVSGLLPNYSKSTIIFGSVGMKDKSIWVINEDVSDSWAWKNILNLRNDVRKFIVINVGNGETTSVIYDNWCKVGILQSFITHRDLYNARRNANMVVKDIVKNGICMWPKEWVSKYPVLGLHKNITLIVDKRDKIIWRTKDGKHVQFTMNQTYNDLGSNDGIVKWHKLVWFSQNIPKHSFILWIAIQNKLVTQDKIRK